MSIKLEEPLLDELTKSTNFFNGRLLTAGDLKADQQANRQARQRLGRAVGDGIASGLEVSQVVGSPGGLSVLEVSAGLAVNRSGQTLALPNMMRVELTRNIADVPPDTGIFTDCNTGDGTGSSNLASGVYVFVISPASSFSGSAPMRGFTGSKAVASCASGSTIEGVQFRLVKLDLQALAALQTHFEYGPVLNAINYYLTQGNFYPSIFSLIRNYLAYICYGIYESFGVPVEPFKQVEKGVSAFAAYGALDFMRTSGALTNCDVPLALVAWQGSTLRFIDMWAVRRRITRPSPTQRWPPFLNDRRMAEGEAMFYQFQDHLETVLAEVGEEAVEVNADNYFRFLPAAGLLPTAGNGFNGFSYQEFFDYSTSPIPLDGGLLRQTLAVAPGYDPIDLHRYQNIYVYNITQTVENDSIQPYILFTSPLMPSHYSCAQLASGVSEEGSKTLNRAASLWNEMTFKKETSNSWIFSTKKKGKRPRSAPRASAQAASRAMEDFLRQRSEDEGFMRDIRRSNAEAKQKRVLAGIEPETQQTIGQTVTLRGSFDTPPEANEVTIDHIVVTEFLAGSSESELSFNVPATIIVPAQTTKSVKLTVKNTQGEAQHEYVLLPQAQTEPTPPAPPPATGGGPNINSVSNLDNPSSGGGTGALLETTRRALIQGEGFAVDPTQNEVRFRFTKGAKTVVYRVEAEAPETDMLGSALVVNVPDIDEINLGFTAEVLLEVGAPGADEPAGAEFTVKVRRLRPAS